LKKTYKYAQGLTSQLSFCSTPLRLDPYNKCQFGCEYCFAATREGFGRDSKMQIGSPKALRDRFLRIKRGFINSALDEFIEQRIPFQLGGMSDPFSKIEETEGVTYKFIEVLNEFNYPFITSTKSALIGTKKYVDLLKESNVYVRISVTIINDELRVLVDKGCSSIEDIFKCCSNLKKENIPISLRFQPIIPGFEDQAYQLIDMASELGIDQISFEYLKVSLDANKNFGKTLKNILNNNPIQFYKKMGAKQYGREYILPLEYRINHLHKLWHYTKSKNILFGFADNDLLIHSDGHSCCNASDKFLDNANFFTANIVSLAKTKVIQEKIYFSDYLKLWIPEEKISTYLNSTSRLKLECPEEKEWISMLRKSWLGKNGIYKPDYFDGIIKLTEEDTYGLPIYQRISSSFENKLAL